jgi:hypothetical protein
MRSGPDKPIALLVVALGCGVQPSIPLVPSPVGAVVPAEPPPAAMVPPEVVMPPPLGPRVEGRVLDLNSLSPLAGRIILVGDQQVTTDEEGRFALDDVAPVYDLFVAETDRSMVSIYEHLSRRDPLVAHEPTLGSVRRGTPSVYGAGVSQAARTPFTPPSLLMPVTSTVITSAIRFSWTPCEHCVSSLKLSVNVPSPKNPDITLYTSATSTDWPDLSKLGIDFPSGAAEYTAWLHGLRVPTMDDAVGPDGLAGPVRPFVLIARTHGYVTLVVPPAPTAGAARGVAQAPCDVPEGEIVTCGKMPVPRMEGSTEWYQLSAMNLKLRCYPDFAASVGIQCVRDCLGARAWYKAYEKYERAHPGFDANQPHYWPLP